MVQRLSLYADLNPQNYVKAVRSLEVFCGMEAHKFNESRSIYVPISEGDLFRLFLVRSEGKTYLESSEAPEAGKAIKVISQSYFRAEILDGNVDNFMTDLGYRFDSDFEVEGVEFVYNQLITFKVFKILTEASKDLASQYVVSMSVDVETVTDLKAVDLATQQLLNAQQELKSCISFRRPQNRAFNTRTPRGPPAKVQ